MNVERRGRLILLVATGAGGLVLALTGCATAVIPAIGADLGASQFSLQWFTGVFHW